jgi:hypothetical protein
MSGSTPDETFRGTMPGCTPDGVRLYTPATGTGTAARQPGASAPVDPLGNEP